MLKQIEILKAVTTLLKDKLKLNVYADEIQEGFKTPCLFVKLIKRTQMETKAVNFNQLSIIITYIASSQKNKEIEFLNITDDVYLLFDMGFKVTDRFLKTKTCSNEKIGEKQDVLQITLTYEYLDNTSLADEEQQKDVNKDYWLIEEVHTKINVID